MISNKNAALGLDPDLGGTPRTAWISPVWMDMGLDMDNLWEKNREWF